MSGTLISKPWQVKQCKYFLSATIYPYTRHIKEKIALMIATLKDKLLYLEAYCFIFCYLSIPLHWVTFSWNCFYLNKNYRWRGLFTSFLFQVSPLRKGENKIICIYWYCDINSPKSQKKEKLFCWAYTCICKCLYVCALLKKKA